MKIAILGHSGSGKSTLARKLAEIYKTDVLHFDTVQFLPNWEIRDLEDKKRITKEFLDSHDSWIIDGNYSRLYFDRRMQEADLIIILSFNRFSCLYRAFRRYLKYKNTTRPDMAEGCNEKFDLEFIKWILLRQTKVKFKDVVSEYGNKVVLIKNQKQLDKYLKKSYPTI
ncbi:MAG: DNA topology modulation protein [Ruminococcaceae bacterium]|nr:DNA topology modulation protein [Oscillospiraceae bacterium]